MVLTVVLLNVDKYKSLMSDQSLLEGKGSFMRQSRARLIRQVPYLVLINSDKRKDPYNIRPKLGP